MNLDIATSLPRQSALAQRNAQPLVVMTSLPGCPYCDLVRDHHLGPMAAAKELVAIQLNITDSVNLIDDFDGVARTAKAISKRWDARFAPTLLFFNASGKEIAERIVGVAVPDFFGAYLEQRLDTARRTLKA
ncbi:MAG: thioredoxin fold domain-containing protein [Burkholderiaceae bacterium]|jgi:thioredoxin-related protein|nr:thioredoxin fold domain-containing protein [Burkholderiaceae bacterium]